MYLRVLVGLSRFGAPMLLLQVQVQQHPFLSVPYDSVMVSLLSWPSRVYNKQRQSGRYAGRHKMCWKFAGKTKRPGLRPLPPFSCSSSPEQAPKNEICPATPSSIACNNNHNTLCALIATITTRVQRKIRTTQKELPGSAFNSSGSEHSSYGPFAKSTPVVLLCFSL